MPIIFLIHIRLKLHQNHDKGESYPMVLEWICGDKYEERYARL